MRACILGGLACLISAAALADSAPEVSTALAEWKQAVEGHSAEAIVKLYDKDAIMISTFVQNPMTQRAQLLDYYRQVVSNQNVKVEIQEQHPRRFGDMALNSGRYTLSYEQEGEPVSIPARFSFAYVLKDGHWLIADQHSSRVPLPESKKE